MGRGCRLLCLLSLMACAPQNAEPPNSGPAPEHAVADTVQLRGTVAVVGSAPMNVAVLLREVNGESVRVAGPLADEIRRLAGADVEVTGSREPDPMYGHAIQATGYSVHGVDGVPVITGTVEQAPDGRLQLRLDDGRALRLVGGEDRLRPGQKIWVQGPTTVQVQSFGVISP